MNVENQDDRQRLAGATQGKSGLAAAEAGSIWRHGDDELWTDDQWAAITSAGGRLVVSAAAGSGKTGVLARRCACLLCEQSEPREPDELLVLTFTEAAAAEMKERIADAVRRIAAASSKPELRTRAALVERVQISTIHAYCKRMLWQNCRDAGIDPATRVMDADEARILLRRSANDAIAAALELPEVEGVTQLLSRHCADSESVLVGHMLQMINLLNSLEDPEAWVANARFSPEHGKTLAELPAAGRLMQHVVRSTLRKIQEAVRLLDAALVAGTKHNDHRYDPYVQQLFGMAESVMIPLKEGKWDAAVAAAKLPDGKFPGLPRSRDPQADVKAAVQLGQKAYKDVVYRDDLLAMDEASLLASVSKTAPAVNALLALVQDCIGRYAAAKRQAVAMDFSDLEHRMLTLLTKAGTQTLREPSEVAVRLRKRYRSVLVDEFQDTNGVQDQIIRLITQEDLHPTECDSFRVGDLKQSIYGFRNADPSIMAALTAELRGSDVGHVIDLRSNFRSRQPLLDAINQVFAKLMVGGTTEIDYDETHRFDAGLVYPEGGFTGSPIQLQILVENPAAAVTNQPAGAGGDHFPHAVREGDGVAAQSSDSGDDASGEDVVKAEVQGKFIAGQIAEWVTPADGSPAKRILRRDPETGHNAMLPCRYSDIAILLRVQAGSAPHYARALRDQGIPVHTGDGGGLLEAMEVQQAMALLQVLDNRRQDLPLAAVIRGPMLRLPDADRLIVAARVKHPAAAGGVPLHEAIVRFAEESTEASDDGLRLKTALQRIDDWRKVAMTRPVSELLETLYADTEFLTYVCGLPDGTQRRANLLELRDHASRYAKFGEQGLGGFIEYIESFGDETRGPGEAAIATEADDSVRIMTIHAAKGLEFPVVFVPQVERLMHAKAERSAVLIDRDLGVGLHVVDPTGCKRYPSLAFRAIAAESKRQRCAEELRLLYVAMTRAREQLVLVGSVKTIAKLFEWPQVGPDQSGRFDDAMVTDASSMLDWLGPISCQVPASVQLNQLTWSDVLGSSGRQQRRTAVSKAVRDRRPLAADPGLPEPVARVLKRVSFSYPHRAAAEAPASRSVTSIAHGYPHSQHGAHAAAGRPAEITATISAGAQEPEQATADEAALAAVSAGRSAFAVDEGSERPSMVDDLSGRPLPMGPRPLTSSTVLEAPKFARGASPILATDRGLINHTVLEHLRFGDPDIKRQVQEMVNRKILLESEVAEIDFAAIQWLCSQPTGKLLAKGDALNELSVYLPADPETHEHSHEPFDRAMIRGRIDVFVPTPAGGVLIDYKTDRVDDSQVLEERIATYSRQLGIYAKALSGMLGKPIEDARLVFLTRQLIVSVKDGQTVQLA